jgi:xanthine dehydrogenase/oxidase
VLKIPRNSIDVSVTRIGGAFCGKTSRTLPVALLASLVSQRLNRPAKFRLPREVDTAVCSGDRPFLAKFQVGFDDNGKVTALTIDNYIDGGFSYRGSEGVCFKSMAHEDSTYNVPHFTARFFVCQTHKLSSTCFRGYGCQHASLATDAAFERVAAVLKMRPEVVKQRNFYKPNDVTPWGMKLPDVTIDQCWSLLATPEFARRRALVKQFNNFSHWKKRGIAITPLKFGVGSPVPGDRKGSALIHVYLDGSVKVSHSGVEFGQGIHTKMCQIAADALAVPLKDVRIDYTELKILANTVGTGYGQGSDVCGPAVRSAAEQLAVRLAPYRKPGVAFADAVKAARDNQVDLSCYGFYAGPKEDLFLYVEFGAAASEVEIDVLTGEHKVLRTDIVVDAGQSLNPGIDMGQAEGGFLQGYGWLTKESPWITDNSCKWCPPGTNLTANFKGYKLPEMSDVPNQFNVTLLPNSHNSKGILSSRGIGEPPLILANSVAFALVAAIYAARKDLGVKGAFDLDFPLTPDKIRKFTTGQ